ncbi:GNAT family N-acetyltransferase [Streptomyces sp. IB2014 016-6]|uniref:GNAT family N-acetyltransferase n=1 Tax=Streptomyces sp. IB2014 016-6 TaxID=2517818 RepID=UPI0011C80C99|nr:GNAT family N-acetyltransferase [Streptomyces sp. IB2014 016-6]TXL89007.1 GNAT family N-acetyltransferase [Streptomyces sp. IB2014 016-6]
MTTDLRVLEASDWDRWFGTLERAFGGALVSSAEQREMWRSVTECERSIGAWDGDECVGTAGAYTFGLSVPGGGVVSAAGVTMVSVAATHRRRGILTSMMRRQLDDVRGWGQAVALLTASEPEIYGRFGYGVGARQLSAEIDTSRVSIKVPTAPGDGGDGGDGGTRLRYAAPDDAREAIESVYARLVASRPGMLERRPGWDRKLLIDPPETREGASALQCVLARRGEGDDAETVGYALYRIKPLWDSAGPKGTVVVDQLAGLDPVTYATLWRFLGEIDLTSTVSASNLPVDDPIQFLVSDVRRAGIGVRDSLHVRLVEVGAALAARAYQAPVDVVFEVDDAFCPWNEGRWRLTGDEKGASCERTADAADLSLSVRELATMYLGDTSPAALARAGLVRELRPGALTEASIAFASPVAPWLPHGF